MEIIGRARKEGFTKFCMCSGKVVSVSSLRYSSLSLFLPITNESEEEIGIKRERGGEGPFEGHIDGERAIATLRVEDG
jgi:hypothetical protein